MRRYYIGLLSGTSMDAIDAAIVDFDQQSPKLIATHTENIPEEIKTATRALYSAGNNEIHRLGELDIIWGTLFAKAAQHVLEIAGVKPEEIKAIGSHGQTIRHSPKSTHPFTLQIGDPNTITALTGITTIADFRRMDIACGGQGAPLAPIFHQHLFHKAQHDTMVVNIGGIANISYLPADLTKKCIGFDTGPGNTLLDAWCRQHINQAFDQNGTWAMQGKVDMKLLKRWLEDPYFYQTPPKSTGPEYFNLSWIDTTPSPIDTQRTLLELTAVSITQEIIRLNSTPSCEILICGGGARNIGLMTRLRDLLGGNFSVKTTDAYGIAHDWLEAILFAWLAKMRIENKALNLKNFTGAHKNVLMGGIYEIG